MTARLVVLLLLPVAAAATLLVHPPSAGSFDPVEVEVKFAPLAPGATVGPNSTNASASVASTLLGSTVDVLHLNNENATQAYYARLELIGLIDIGILDTLTLGIDNGTAVAQLVISAGTVVDGDGDLVRLEPGSTNTIYVTEALGLLGSGGVTFWAVVADDASESAYVRMYGAVSVT